MVKTKQIPFSSIVAALLDDQNLFPPRYLHRFSDLSPKDAEALAKAWPKVSPQRRIALMEDLEELGQADDLLSFEDVCYLALKDPLPDVRICAVRILRDYELVQLVPDFMHIARTDVNTDVRATAAAALGVFIYMGEVEELQPTTLKRVEECLLGIFNGADENLVRRRALEALGFSSREEVPPAIEESYNSGDPDWVISALVAMGRSADKVWKPKVIAMFDHLRPAVRAEAASAAGELEIKSTVPALRRMLRDSDQDVRMAAIWALSQLGGKGVRSALEKLLEVAMDSEEEELIENALENLDFTEDMHSIALLEISDSEEDDEDFFEDDELDDLPDDGETKA